MTSPFSHARRASLASVAALSTTLALGAPAAFGQAAAQAPAAPVTTTSATLRAGAFGPGVLALQAALGVRQTGVFGAQTRRAVRRFQRRHGLAVDGVVGRRTAAALALVPAATPATTASAGATDPTLQRIAACESGGDPTAVSADGRYRGKYQFTRATWRSMGGHGDPAAAPEAEQDRRAAALLAQEGTAPWPICAA